MACFAGATYTDIEISKETFLPVDLKLPGV